LFAEGESAGPRSIFKLLSRLLRSSWSASVLGFIAMDQFECLGIVKRREGHPLS
jgi:hypothetical protein